MDAKRITIPPDAEDYLQIRYLKLHFYLEILEEGIIPRHKVSALRGGMGHMLLMSNCIRDENCSACDFEEDCLVRRMMYPRMHIRPQFMTQQDSEGYVLECENTEERFHAGDILEFNLLLLGRTIVYFTQFLQAFHYLGMQGLGKNHVPFRVKCVTNSKGKPVVDGSNVYKENCVVLMIADYVRYRLSRLASENLEKNREKNIEADKTSESSGCSDDAGSTLVFHSPLTLKYKGDLQKSFSPEAIIAAVERRLYILNCFEGRQDGEDYKRINVMEHIPVLKEQRVYTEKVNRFSGTQNTKVAFYGIKGHCRFEQIDDAMKALLIAGELVHIGKNTSFGFGRYTIIET